MLPVKQNVILSKTFFWAAKILHQIGGNAAQKLTSLEISSQVRITTEKLYRSEIHFIPK